VIGYHDLAVWKKDYRSVLDVHQATGSFPASERFGLVSQMRRAAISIASNLAEGVERNSARELMRHTSIAAGSATGIECRIEISGDLGLPAPDGAPSLLRSAREVRRMIQGLHNASGRSEQPQSG
jgi:four helix bundle protein